MSKKDHPNNAPGVPMVFPVWFENLQVKYLNSALKPIARYLPGTGTIEHRGRKSGKSYKTIVTAYRKGNVLAIALAHGKTDWVKNVLAAGQADLRFARREVHLTTPDTAGRLRRPGCSRAAVAGESAVAPDGGIRQRYRLSVRRGRPMCAQGETWLIFPPRTHTRWVTRPW
jgi:deazaflavin-dependent oxidoreductase (nitroreductase family)